MTDGFINVFHGFSLLNQVESGSFWYKCAFHICLKRPATEFIIILANAKKFFNLPPSTFNLPHKKGAFRPLF
ncbi:hypothetical protein ELI_2549 [Eubacterium callanderi]|uniref:Uncharacterized protein n=1 Tax=Eubacterium callanderi TaxID=53442 RepID=E3GE36_9FIRM|nr:hypothetical protein ELI_2549 [Eubacterium callanderi]